MAGSKYRKDDQGKAFHVRAYISRYTPDEALIDSSVGYGDTPWEAYCYAMDVAYLVDSGSADKCPKCLSTVPHQWGPDAKGS